MPTFYNGSPNARSQAGNVRECIIFGGKNLLHHMAQLTFRIKRASFFFPVRVLSTFHTLPQEIFSVFMLFTFTNLHSAHLQWLGWCFIHLENTPRDTGYYWLPSFSNYLSYFNQFRCSLRAHCSKQLSIKVNECGNREWSCNAVLFHSLLSVTVLSRLEIESHGGSCVWPRALCRWDPRSQSLSTLPSLHKPFGIINVCDSTSRITNGENSLIHCIQ